MRGQRGGREECDWVWNCHPLKGSSCAFLIKIQQTWEKGEGWREGKRDIPPPPNKEAHS